MELLTGMYSAVKILHTYITSRTKGLIAFTPEKDCDQAAMGLPPITSGVLLIAK
jgi:hypothetical protein